VLVDSNQKDYAPVFQWYQAGDNPQGSHTFDVFPRPPPPSTALPVNTRLKGYYRHPASLFDGTTVIEWTDKAMWIVEPEYRSWEMQHIFFWAKSVFGLWEARVGNSSWGGGVPPIEEVRARPLAHTPPPHSPLPSPPLPSHPTQLQPLAPFRPRPCASGCTASVRVCLFTQSDSIDAPSSPHSLLRPPPPHLHARCGS
jgi:hypothetical protein